MRRGNVRALTAVVAVLLLALVGSTCATASPVHATAYVPQFPVEVMERPFEPRQLPPGGVHVATVGLDLVSVAATTPVRISLAGALAQFDPEGARAHEAIRVAGRLVLASDGDWGDPGEPPRPTFSDRLSWFLVYSGTPVSFQGSPAGRPDPVSRLLVEPEWAAETIENRWDCTSYGLVDATTGVFREAWQSCRTLDTNPYGW